MTYIIIGITTSLFVILFLEIFKSFDKKLMAAFTLTGIAFIYVGFTWSDLLSLGVVVVEVFIFILLAYYGYTKDFRLIVLGLVLHGFWDMIFPHYSPAIPDGYDLFCLTVDILLALYFYIRMRDFN